MKAREEKTRLDFEYLASIEDNTVDAPDYDDYIEINQAFLQNRYLKNWRKKSKITFNKRDTYKLVQALQNLLPEY